jgi:hypothetical protein
VLTYALWNVNNFSWGKTRKVVKEPEPEIEKVTEIRLNEVENVIENEIEKPAETDNAVEIDNATGSEEVGAPREEEPGEGLVTVIVADLPFFFTVTCIKDYAVYEITCLIYFYGWMKFREPGIFMECFKLYFACDFSARINSPKIFNLQRYLTEDMK